MKGLLKFSFAGVSRDRFEKSQWCPSDRVSIWYVIYRVLVPVFLFSGITTAIINFKEDNRLKWFIYLTDQGITWLAIHFSIEAAIVVARFIRDRSASAAFEVNPSSPESLPLLYKLSWALGTATFDIALIISIVYWAVLHQGIMESVENPTTLFVLINVFVHGLNALVCIIDMCVSNRPWRPMHFVFPIFYGIFYVSFSFVYYSLGGKGACVDNKCLDFIYPFLDWSQGPLQPLFAVALIFLIDMVLHFVWCGLYNLRLYTYGKVVGKDEYINEGFQA